MIRFNPFRGSDFLEVVQQPPLEAGMSIPFNLNLDVCRALEGNAWSGWVGASVVACGGTVPVWQGRNLAWCYLTRPAKRYLLKITNLAAEVIAHAPGRVEATVRADYPGGHRWMERLGFEVEAPLMRRFGPYGEDHVGYVRHNDVIRTNGIPSN